MSRDRQIWGLFGALLVGVSCSSASPTPAQPQPRRSVGSTQPDSPPTPVATKATAATGIKAPYIGQPLVAYRYRDGLVIEDYAQGQGQAVQYGSSLKIRYAGYLRDGTRFTGTPDDTQESHRLRVSPRSRPTGWVRGLLGMKPGGLRKISVPPNLGYGAKGFADIGPNEALVYTVELLELTAPPPAPQKASAYSGRVLARKRHKSGLVTQDYALGSGEAVALGAKVQVHYTGYLPDQSVFDSTLDQQQGTRLQVGSRHIIKGLNQGLLGMKVGGLRKITIPAKLGYGKQKLDQIPPNTTLTFTVELMELKNPANSVR